MGDEELVLPAPVRAALSQLPEPYRVPIETALSALAPLIALDAAEVMAAVAAAEDARGSAEHNQRLAAELEIRLASALEREQQRWTEAIAVVMGVGDSTKQDLDRLAAVLGVDERLATAVAFDDFMLDEDEPLRLGPARDTATPREPILAGIARPVTSPPALDVENHQRLLAPGRIATSVAGFWIQAADGPAVLLGDGTTVGLLEGTARRARAEPDGTQGAYELRVGRLARGQPPLLQRHAAAALASCVAARSATVPVEPEAFAAWLGVGAAIPLTEPPRARLAEVASLLRELARVDNVHQGAAVLLSLAWECARVRPYLGEIEIEIENMLPAPVIHVGQIRWCTLTDRPVSWLPVFPDDPDTVGGGDRPWATDIPSAGARWETSSPALRLDREWAAALVVVPGSSRLMAIDPAGAWWDLDSDYEAIVLSRRRHREPWLDALEVLDRDVPDTIAASMQQAEQTREARGASVPEVRLDLHGRNPGDPPSKFSAEWIRGLAGRYAYPDDAAAQDAGREGAERGHYTREEFLAIVDWKSARARPLAERNTEEAIVEATRRAFAADDEVTRLVSLLALDGVGVPVASALLHFAFPDRYPILDFRALATLGVLTRRTTYSPAFWVDYLDECRALAADAHVTIRELDKALWQASKESAL